ncbi:hypothetical protein Vadar_008788 [Vaccinium darrowii]|uniref:Uncharacterized protein n=3 Tax=Vaccinium darrowii TaxID=229202 RepID=A0ACB7XYT3_9ERIC|nr:hypothetical protein Vadar_033983 [Vaccinium darrowii]KAH7845860.1 hypothetical protein Vadar_006763 [Vaccinium darrowii]KAH7862740.1 hypothetical protein Vadar_008788 [Vaccinium darrowii]
MTNFSDPSLSLPENKNQTSIEREREMKSSPVDLFADLEDPNSTMAMDLDDVEALEMFGEGPVGSDNKLTGADADFFNPFQNDF